MQATSHIPDVRNMIFHGVRTGAALMLLAAPGMVMAQATASATYEDIIITAERRRESLQRSSLAISVVGAETLDRAGLTQASSLSTITPGVQIGGNGAFTQIFIRGIGDRSNTFLSNASVATSLNGVPLLRSTQVNGNFFDLERVEVLKGPQGTLYGRNATGGAINIISARPKDELEGRLNLEAGSHDLFRVDGALNMPLGPTFALRGAFQIVSRDGYLSDGTSDDQQQNLRLSTYWQPSDDVSLLLVGGYSHQGGKGSGMALVYPRCPAGGSCLDPWTGITDARADVIRRDHNPPASTALASYPAPGYPSMLDNELTYLSAELNWDIGDVTLTLLPAFVRNHYRANTYPGLVFSNDIVARQYSMEGRLSHEGERLKWVAGFYLVDERQAGGNPVIQNTDGSGVSAYNRLTGDGASINSKAIFGQATYSLTGRLRAIAGLRYTHETAGLNQQQYSCSFTRCPGPLAFSIDNREVTTERVTYKTGLEFDLTPDNFLFATYSTGFKAAGLYTAPLADPSYRPERVAAIELGSRNRFFDGRVQLNLEAYRWNYRDQVYNFVGPVPGLNYVTLVFLNIGKGRVQGLSGDLIVRPWTGGTLRLAADYADSSYDVFTYEALIGQRGPANTRCAVGPVQPNAQGIPVQTVDCSGKPFIMAPSISGTAAFDQRFDTANGAEIGATVTVGFTSSRYSQFDFLETQKLPATAIVDIDLAYSSPGRSWTVGAYVHNIGNVASYSQSQSLTGTGNGFGPAGGPVIAGTIGAPRTAGVKLSYRF